MHLQENFRTITGQKLFFSNDCYWFYNSEEALCSCFLQVVDIEQFAFDIRSWGKKYSFLWQEICALQKRKFLAKNQLLEQEDILNLRIKKIFQPVVDTYTENRFFGFNTPVPPVQYKYLISNQFVRPEEKIVAWIYHSIIYLSIIMTQHVFTGKIKIGY